MKAGSKQFKEAMYFSYWKSIIVNTCWLCNISKTRDIAIFITIKKDLMDYY
ncbi:hypothetical protein HYE30_03150 [Mycoplasmopsis bovis]|nr:hypothetical protein [Mycoplasmopsis bovis]QQH22597.1 hypothetical protein HYE30_03150 [Mycoplasmopsis bovis]